MIGRLLVTFMILLFVVQAAARVIDVCKSCAIQSVEVAIKNSTAGDEIHIQTGLYEEEGLIIPHRLTLKGLNGPVIRHKGAERDTILIKAEGTIIEGLNLQGSGKSSFHDFAAIKVSNTKNCVIRNNLIENAQYGILVANSEGCQVRENRISTSSVPVNLLGDAIHFWKSPNPRIIGNVLKGHRDGIYLEFVKEGWIEKNKVLKNHRYGLHFMFSNSNTFQDNVFHDNDAGVAVMYSQKIQMIRNTYSRNRGAASFGVLLKDISDSKIVNNKFIDNTVGLFMEGSNRNEFKSNLFAKNGWAIRLLSSCEGNRFSQNAFTRNTLEIATNSERSLNSFSQNFWDAHVALDLDKDGFADLPYQPTSYSSYLVEKYSLAILLLETPFLKMLDRLEKAFPALSPVSMRDPQPLLKFPEGLYD